MENDRRGKLLLRWRYESGLSQEQVAVALGLSQSAYSKREKGDTPAKLSELEQLARLYNRDYDQMVIAWNGEDDPVVEKIRKLLPHLPIDQGRAIWMLLEMIDVLGVAPMIDFLSKIAAAVEVEMGVPPWLDKKRGRVMNAKDLAEILKDPRNEHTRTPYPEPLRAVSPPVQRAGFVEHTETEYHAAPPPPPAKVRKDKSA